MVMICWGLWSSRNDCVWKGVLFVVDVVLNMSLSLWTNMRSANVVELPTGGMEEPVVLWKKPDARHLKSSETTSRDASPPLTPESLQSSNLRLPPAGVPPCRAVELGMTRLDM
nr:uncharacterized protein LOC109162706 [Ipomoea batatas]